jgi:hypothetical protein
LIEVIGAEFSAPAFRAWPATNPFGLSLSKPAGNVKSL